MACCEFGRVLQSVQDSTYESKDDGMMYGRIGWVVHYVVIYFLNFFELN